MISPNVVARRSSLAASMAKRPASSPPPAPKRARSNPLQLKPLGNLMLAPQHSKTRSHGLGHLARLPDELLLNLFSSFSGEDLVRLSSCSRACLAWSHVEGIWKGCYIARTQGRLLHWSGSWRTSYLATFLRPGSVPPATPFPSEGITTPTLHSDVLFQPHLCASFDPASIFSLPSFIETVPRLDGRHLTPSTLPTEPTILTGLMDDWPAFGERKWQLDALRERFPDIPLRAEATLTTLVNYASYHDDCTLDESPLYLFESEFVEKTAKGTREGLGEDYTVPACFREDLFEVMGSARPDYRWLIVGPARSGSTWHQDPNGTSAWNAVTQGAKAWIMFDGSLTPPGVYVSDDRATVEAPLSLAEWFFTYYAQSKAMYGSKGKDPKLRGRMTEGICRAGEIFYVPSGWWHIVINLEPSIAVTQNFVSLRELSGVLHFMRDRPEQVSGFKLVPSTTAADGGVREEEGTGLEETCELVSGVYEAFCSALEEGRGEEEEVQRALREVRERVTLVVTGEKERVKGLWESVKDDDPAEGGLFSFGFGDGEPEDEGIEL